MNPLTLMKLLSDETRLKLVLLILQEEELCVCELMTALDVSQPKISRHLAMLKKEALLIDRKQKQWVFYRINNELTQWVKCLVQQLMQSNKDYIYQELSKLERMGNRPDRKAICC